MGFRMERIQGRSRVAYILYSQHMAYLATLSWLNGRLVYDTVRPEMVAVSARDFEAEARALDEAQS